MGMSISLLLILAYVILPFMFGTIVNVIAILIGGTIGTVIGNRLPEKIKETVMNGLGLCTLVIGMEMALQSKAILIVMASILIGGILGEWWRIEDGLNWLGNQLEAKIQNGATNSQPGAENPKSISRAFVTATLIFCVGPLAIVGSLLDGLVGNSKPLLIKSLLDGFASLAFGASLGPGVLFSAGSILIYQGGISLLAKFFGQSLGHVTAQTPAIMEMSATGGILILAIGLLLLDLKRIRVGNFLPSIILAPLIVLVLEFFKVL